MVQSLALQRILENPFNTQLQGALFCGQLQASRQVLMPKLKVTYHQNDDDIQCKVSALTKEKTIEFAKKALARWGSEAEKVLSATETGCLYWNVIHHFGSFNAFLLNVV
jgi:hypothetical protein